MGAPTNLSDQGAGEMSAAARTHGEPIMRLNQLTRWYIMTSLFLVLMYLLSEILDPLFNISGIDLFVPLSFGAFLMFLGGIGIKFLPGSLGGNPHVYSLNLALWSYWLLVSGTLIWSFSNVLLKWVDRTGSGGFFASNLVISLGPSLMLLGTLLLLVNLWKTMQSRV